MTPRELLEAAIAQAKPRCRFCGCTTVTAEDRPGLGPIPVSHHYARTLASACPALGGGLRARLVHDDLWAGLDRYLTPADYGADSDLAVVNDELAQL